MKSKKLFFVILGICILVLAGCITFSWLSFPSEFTSHSAERTVEITNESTLGNPAVLSTGDIDKIVYIKQGWIVAYNNTQLPELGIRLLLTLQSLNLQATCIFSQESIQEIKQEDGVVELIFKQPMDIAIAQRVEPEERSHIPTYEDGYRILENVERAIFVLEDTKGEGLEEHVLTGGEREDRDERCSWKVTEEDKEKYKELGPIWSMSAGYEFDEERGCIPVGGSKYIKDVVPFKTKEECELACGRMWSCWTIEKGDEGLDKGWIDEINEIISTEEYLGIHCCEECLEAFSGCPITVGPEALMCGKFSSGYNMSEECKQYFKEHPASVSKCESLLEIQSETQNVTAPSTNYHSAIFCNSSFELIPSETTIPTKSTCKQTNFLTERFL